MNKQKELSGPEKFTFFILIMGTFPFSLIYLGLWRARCVHCGRRILFNKRVCKKCVSNSSAIIDDFDKKIAQFAKAMEQVHDLRDIINYHVSTIKNIEAAKVIQEEIGNDIAIEDMISKIWNSFDICMNRWCDLNASVDRKDQINELFIDIIDTIDSEEIKKYITEYQTKIQAL